MNLIVLSHKEAYILPDSPSGYATTGGFPFQMRAISDLFDQTTLMLPTRLKPAPTGVNPLAGYNLSVIPLPEPTGVGLKRKVGLLGWLPRNFLTIWQGIARAEAVHAPVPGDIGFIGILIALLQRKPLFVRHCGTWVEPVSGADKILVWLLEHVAGGRNVVLATGGADNPPSKKNPHIDWIFSTTLTDAEMSQLPAACPWQGTGPLRLVTACRLVKGKNVQAVIQALSGIQERFPNISFDIAGDGEYRGNLEKLAREYQVENRVIFHGNLSHSEVIKLLAGSHLFIFPTRVKEGFPKAVLEALAVGLPVVATGVSVVPQLIRDCGIILEETSPEAVKDAVCLLAAQPKLVADMAVRARQRAKEYTLETWINIIRERLDFAWSL